MRLDAILGPAPTNHATRDTEWLCSALLTAWAAILALPGDSFANPVFAPLRSAGLPEVACALAVGALGLSRLVVLWVNGRSPRTPRLREIGATVGSLVWLQLAVVVMVGSERSFAAVPPVVAIYGGLALAELRSLLRASFDVRYSH